LFLDELSHDLFGHYFELQIIIDLKCFLIDRKMAEGVLGFQEDQTHLLALLFFISLMNDDFLERQ
jgi:hypothetical protein